MTELLKKDRFYWNVNAKEAIKKLKVAMKDVQVLALPDFPSEFVVEIDAFGHRLGLVLLQINTLLPISARCCHRKRGECLYIKGS